MPQDLSCPKCNHVFPVTEARHPVGVQCPGCDVDLTAEFRKPSGPPAPGAPLYEMLVKLGKPPGGASATDVKKKKSSAEDEEEERRGGSMAIVVIAALGALLIALGGLATTGYFLFTNLDTSDSAINTLNHPTANKGNNPGNKGSNPGNKGPNPITDPGGRPKEQPKKIDKFRLDPIMGPPASFTPPPIDLSSPQTVLLPGKAGAICVGGGGRYIVMHFPDQGRLSVFDVNAGEFIKEEGVSKGNAHLAAGSTKVVLTVPGNKLQVYSLPELKAENSFSHPLFHGIHNMAMGSRTNSPLLITDVFGSYALMDIGPGKVIEATEGQGLPHEMVRAMPDGKAYLVSNGYSPNHKTSILDEKDGKWRLRQTDVAVSFPGADSKHFFAVNAIMDTTGKFVAGKGAATTNVWYVPSLTTGGSHLLKLTEIKPAAGKRAAVSLTLHKGTVDKPAPGTPTLQSLPELEGFADQPFGGVPPLDQHFFLIPPAHLLAIINLDKTKMVLRKVDLK